MVKLHGYSNAELLSREEELSLVMLLNRVQTEEDLDFSSLTEEQRAVVEKIVRIAPQDVLQILAQMVYHLGLKIKLPDEKLVEYVRNVEDRDMGELWAHMDDINVPERMRTLEKEAKEKVEKAQQEAQETVEKAQQKAQETIEKAQQEARKKVKRVRKNAQKKVEKAQKESQEKDKVIAELQAEIERLKN